MGFHCESALVMCASRFDLGTIHRIATLSLRDPGGCREVRALLLARDSRARRVRAACAGIRGRKVCRHRTRAREKLIIGQTANVLEFLGQRLKLAPREVGGRHWVNVHHPISSGLYYEEQKGAAKRRARDFLKRRVPKFLGYFEKVMERNPAGGPGMVGSRLT